jgi:NADH dehydrogenase/NADH:ubiquinone oxidoreductase subunit G
MAEKVNLTIDGIDISVDKGCSVLDAARQANIKIPVLCHHPDINVAGNCRVCVVEQIGARTLPVSCATPAVDGMEILTNSHKVRTARKHIIELLLSEHNADCTKCYKNGKCELQDLAAEYKISNDFFIDLVPLKNYSIDKYSPSIIKDDSKCIRCQRCVRVCEELQSVSAISCAHKGQDMKVSTFFEHSLHQLRAMHQPVSHRCFGGKELYRRSMDRVVGSLKTRGGSNRSRSADSIGRRFGERSRSTCYRQNGIRA